MMSLAKSSSLHRLGSFLCHLPASRATQRRGIQNLVRRSNQLSRHRSTSFVIGWNGSTTSDSPYYYGLTPCRFLSTEEPTATRVEVVQPVFSSQAAIQKQRNEDLSTDELALKAAFAKYQSLQDDPNARKESLESLRDCLQVLDYLEDSLAVERALESYSTGLELAGCIFRQGKLHMQLDNIVVANAQYQKALELYKMEHGAIYHADIGTVLVAMAGVHFARETMDECLRTLGDSEDHFRHHGQPNDGTAIKPQEPHPSLTKCLENQGLVYRIKQEFLAALEKYEEALQIVTDQTATDDSDDNVEERQKFQMHVADMLGASGDMDGAIHYYQKIREQDQARRHNPEEETELDGVILHCLGMLHSQQRHLELARDELTQAVKIKSRLLGVSHPEIATSLIPLGSVNGVMGNKREAMDNFQAALLIAKANAGDENDPEVLQIIRNISILKGEKVAKWD